MEEDIMELRARFLHRQVKVVDGSSDEDGEYGLVIGVTARSAEPISVMFYQVGPVQHVNFYQAQDLEIVPGVFSEGRQRDSVVRCHRSRFDALWYVFDCNGVHGIGYGTSGAAWAAFLAEVGRKEEANGKEDRTKADCTLAEETPQDDAVVGAPSGCVVHVSPLVGTGTDVSDVEACPADHGAHESHPGTTDPVGETRAD